MSRVIANTAVAKETPMEAETPLVEAETPLVEAEAIIILMTVAKETPMEAVVMAEAMVPLLNHKTRPNPCDIGVE